MSFSSGTFSLVAGNPVVTGTTISSTTHNNTNTDIATGLSTCLLKDGTQTCTAAIPFVTGVTTTSTTFAVFNTVATTVNAFGAATTLNIGNASGTNTFLGAFQGIHVVATAQLSQVYATGVLAVLGTATISQINCTGVFAAVGTATLSQITGGAVATQAQMEAATATTLFVAPATQQYHPSAAKGWAYVNITGTAKASYNVNAISDTGAGVMAIDWLVDFATTAYCAAITVETSGPWIATVDYAGKAVGATQFRCQDGAGTEGDPDFWHAQTYGDFA